MVFSWLKKITVFVLLTTYAFFGVAASAQVSGSTDPFQSYDSGVNEGDFEFEVTPENPGPHQTVTIKLSSNLVDTNRYPITWTVNGSVVASGIGKRSITVQTGDYGQTTSITMSIALIESTVQKQIVLAPQDATIIWEAVDSYVPPFYQGKKLPAIESLIRIASIPNFLGDKTSSGTKNAVYTWSRNKSVIPDAGGFGRDSILIQHNRVRSNEFIEVTSSSVNGSAIATSSITVPIFDPKILFYEKNGVTGLKSLMAKPSIYLQNDATTIIAEPYFFSVGNNNPDALRYNWMLNGSPITIGSTNKNILSVKNPGSAGSASIGLAIDQPTLLFQAAKNALSVLFQ